MALEVVCAGFFVRHCYYCCSLTDQHALPPLDHLLCSVSASCYLLSTRGLSSRLVADGGGGGATEILSTFFTFFFVFVFVTVRSVWVLNLAIKILEEELIITLAAVTIDSTVL